MLEQNFTVIPFNKLQTINLHQLVI